MVTEGGAGKRLKTWAGPDEETALLSWDPLPAGCREPVCCGLTTYGTQSTNYIWVSPEGSGLEMWLITQALKLYSLELRCHLFHLRAIFNLLLSVSLNFLICKTDNNNRSADQALTMCQALCWVLDMNSLIYLSWQLYGNSNISIPILWRGNWGVGRKELLSRADGIQMQLACLWSPPLNLSDFVGFLWSLKLGHIWKAFRPVLHSQGTFTNGNGELW